MLNRIIKVLNLAKRNKVNIQFESSSKNSDQVKEIKLRGLIEYKLEEDKVISIAGVVN